MAPVKMCKSCNFSNEGETLFYKREEKLASTNEKVHKLDSSVKAEMREMFLYLMLLATITLIILLMIRPSTYFFTTKIRDIFIRSQFYKSIEPPKNSTDSPTPSNSPDVQEENTPNIVTVRRVQGGETSTFESIKNIDQFWEFATIALPDLLYWELWNPNWNQKPIESHVEKDDKTIIYNTRLIGLPRIRQLRVKNTSCVIHSNTADIIKHCYGRYSPSTEERANLFPKDNSTLSTTESAWIYSADEANLYYVQGEINTYYPGGYIIDLGRNSTEVKYIIESLERNEWITAATRAVLIEFTLYNPDVNLFLVCRLLAEMPVTGGIITGGFFHPYRFLRYYTTSDHIVLGLELVFCVCLIGFIISFVGSLKTINFRISAFFFFFLDIIVILLSISCIGLNIYRFVIMEPEITKIMNITDKHFAFDFYATVQLFFEIMCSVLAFLMWTKILQYLAFIPAIRIILKVFTISASKFIGIIIIFVVVTFAIAQLSHLFFGSTIYSYASVVDSCKTIVKSMINEYEYRDMEKHNVVFAPICFVLVLFFLYFVVLNVLVSVMANSYSSVRAEILPQDDYSVHAYFNKLWTHFRNLTNQSTTVDLNPEGRMRNILRKSGFKDYEIDVFFAKYKVKPLGSITEREAKEINEDLLMRKYLFGTDRMPKSGAEFYDVARRLETRAQRVLN